MYDLKKDNKARELLINLNKRAMQKKKKNDMIHTLSIRREFSSFKETFSDDVEEEESIIFVDTPNIFTSSIPTSVTSVSGTLASAESAESAEDAEDTEHNDVKLSKRMAARNAKA